LGPTDERSGEEWVLGTSLAISTEEMARTAPRRPEGPTSLDRLQKLSGGIIELDRVRSVAWRRSGYGITRILSGVSRSVSRGEMAWPVQGRMDRGFNAVSVP